MADTHYVVDDDARQNDPKQGEGDDPPKTNDENENQGAEDVGDDPSEEESRAYRMGWRPESEYRGPPDNFVSAEDYIKKTESEAPLMRRQLRANDDRIVKQSEEIASMKATIEESKKALLDLRDLNRTAETRAFEKAKRDIEERMDEAIEDGDTEAARHARDQLTEHEQTKPKFKPDPESNADDQKASGQPNDQSPQINPIMQAWTNEQDWWDKDPVLIQIAIDADNKILAEHPDMATTDRLIKVGEAVSDYQDYKNGKANGSRTKTNPKRDRATAVSAPSSQGKPGKKGRSVADLPPEAKTVLERLKRMTPGYTDKEYLADYDWS